MFTRLLEHSHHVCAHSVRHHDLFLATPLIYSILSYPRFLPMQEFGEHNHYCLCGRFFNRESALTKHRRICKQSKTQLVSALSGVKETRSRKQIRTAAVITLSTSVCELPTGPSAVPLQPDSGDPGNGSKATESFLDEESSTSVGNVWTFRSDSDFWSA